MIYHCFHSMRFSGHRLSPGSARVYFATCEVGGVMQAGSNDQGSKKQKGAESMTELCTTILQGFDRAWRPGLGRIPKPDGMYWGSAVWETEVKELVPKREDDLSSGAERLRERLEDALYHKTLQYGFFMTPQVSKYYVQFSSQCWRKLSIFILFQSQMEEGQGAHLQHMFIITLWLCLNK